MKLRGIDFGPAWGGSGGTGFFGEGYWFHLYYRKVFGERFCSERLTFVAKTATLNPRRGKKFGEEGNMKLADDGVSPRQRRPDCISATPLGFVGGYLLNAVGLSNMGIRWLLQQKEWQGRNEPFFISFMPVSHGEDMIHETSAFARILKQELPCFRAPVGLQINLSCPNAGADLGKVDRNVLAVLDILSELNIPIVPKLSISTPLEAIYEISRHPACDALVCFNTIPYGKHESIAWQKFFPFGSPLAKYGGGGLSGKPLLPFVCERIRGLRGLGITKPINASGGILHPRDVVLVKKAGADGISIATALALRPWNVCGIIARAHEIF